LLRRHGLVLPATRIVAIPDGERYKTLATVAKVTRRLAQLKADRKTTLLLLGGGVVGDLGGFVAATYLRGIPYVQIPTTLVAQVDSSIGGKVGVDLPEGKNLVGSFYHPRFVFSDVSFLKTLPRRELLSGLGEVVKCGVIRDPELFESLEVNPTSFGSMVSKAARIKAEVVRVDEKETTGLRRILNFGHTFGHALERLTKYRRYSHGEAVAIGMVIAARISHRLGYCREMTARRIRQRLIDLSLPVDAPKFPPGRWLEAIQVDKKSEGGMIHFVFVKEIGTVVTAPTDPRELVTHL